LVEEAYRRQGYDVRRNNGAGPDGGIDLTLRRDGELTLVQCKHWKTIKVGVDKVRELYGVQMSQHVNRSTLITSGFFTQEAKNFAADKPIDLVEGPELIGLIKTFQRANRELLGMPTSSRAFVLCPKCGSEMVLRTAKKGIHAGQKFWGCSRFPACRAITNVEEERCL
jgi:restriction system protein